MNFDSPLGNKKKLKSIEIPDESGWLEEPVDASQANIKHISREEAAALRAEAKKKTVVFNKTRLETLLGLVSHTKEVVVNGITVKLKSLTHGEQADIYKSALLEQTQLTVLVGVETRRNILARSICEINGVSFKDIVVEKMVEDGVELNKENLLENKLLVIDMLGDVFINSLMKEYSLFVKEFESKYGGLTDDNGIAEDIKKA